MYTDYHWPALSISHLSYCNHLCILLHVSNISPALNPSTTLCRQNCRQFLLVFLSYKVLICLLKLTSEIISSRKPSLKPLETPPGINGSLLSHVFPGIYI